MLAPFDRHGPSGEGVMTELQTTWGWLVALDLFFGGLAAGAFCTVAVIALATGKRFQSTISFGAWVSAVAMALGALTLLLDVGQPLRAMVMFKSFVNLNSWMTRGAWLIMGSIVVNGLSALFWTNKTAEWLERLWKPLGDGRKPIQIALAILGIPFNLGVALYTGLLLGVLQFRPLWNSALLPVLFVASALCTGLAVVAGYVSLRETASGARKLGVVLWGCFVVLLVAVGAALAGYLNDRLGASAEAASSAQLITSGLLSGAFWGVVVVIGLAIPLLAGIIQLTGLGQKLRAVAVAVPVIAVLSSLVGGWTMRFLILTAGLPISLSSPVWDQIREGVRFIP